MRILHTLIMILTLLASNSLLAQDHENIQQVGRIYGHFGWTRDVQVRDDFAYIAAGCAGLQIIDITDPTQPTLAGYFDDNAYRACAVSIRGEIACVADETGGLFIVDISDSCNPQMLSQYETCHWYDNSGWCVGVVASEQYAYLAVNCEGLRVLDISDPGNPRLVSTLQTPGIHQHIAKSGNIVYLSALNGGLTLIDVSDPTHPEQICRLLGNDSVKKTLVFDNRAFSLDTDRRGIVVHDITVADEAEEIGFIMFNAYSFGMRVIGDVIYLAVSNSFSAKDISDFENVRELDNFLNNELELMCLDIAGDKAYVSGDVGGFRAFDISDPEDILEVGVYNPPCLSKKIVVSGEHAFIIDTDECMRIVDVSDPTAPEEVACIAGEEIIDMAVNENYAYLATRNGLSIRDIQDISQPSEIGAWGDDGITAITQAGDYLFLGGSDLTILNVEDLTSPELVDFLDQGHAWALKALLVKDDFLYGYRRNEIVCFDISDISNPTLASVCDAGGNIQGMSISGNYAYIANGYSFNLDIYDISEPMNISKVRTYRTDGLTVNVFATRWYAYLVSAFHGLLVIDISNPARPFQTGYYDTPGNATDIAVVDNLAYVVDYSNVGIYDCSEALTVPTESCDILPTSFSLSTPFPNPFNSTTTIGYSLPAAGAVSLIVYDLSGREVAYLADGVKPAGTHEAVWVADGMASGVYVVSLNAGGVIMREKVVLVK